MPSDRELHNHAPSRPETERCPHILKELDVAWCLLVQSCIDAYIGVLYLCRIPVTKSGSDQPIPRCEAPWIRLLQGPASMCV
jgi:hypothetical protein